MTPLGWRAMAIVALLGAGVATFFWVRFVAETVVRSMTGR